MEEQNDKKRRQVIAIPDLSIRNLSTTYIHDMVESKHAMRCRRNCCTGSGKSRVKCMACYVYLCLQCNINCFARFHASNAYTI